jgi:hypothetical protein
LEVANQQQEFMVSQPDSDSQARPGPLTRLRRAEDAFLSRLEAKLKRPFEKLDTKEASLLAGQNDAWNDLSPTGRARQFLAGVK